MGAAARLSDRIAHRYTKDGAWLSTGGGGYDAYRVVPRSWSLVWLAGAHREPPEATPADWRERWAAEAARFDQAPLPETFLDPPNAGLPRNDLQTDAERRSLDTLALVRRLVLPAIVREAEDGGWWSAMDELDRPRTPEADDEPATASDPTLVTLDAAALERLRVVHGVLPVAGRRRGDVAAPRRRGRRRHDRRGGRRRPTGRGRASHARERCSRSAWHQVAGSRASVGRCSAASSSPSRARSWRTSASRNATRSSRCRSRRARGSRRSLLEGAGFRISRGA